MALENFRFPDIQFPSIPGFNLNIGGPTTNQFPNAITDSMGNVVPLPLSQPGAGMPNPADMPTNPTPTDIILSQPGGAEQIQMMRAMEQGGQSDLSMFNPPGIFGFGLLGQQRQGISEQLAQALGIEQLTANQFSQQQLSFLQQISSNITSLQQLGPGFNFAAFGVQNPFESQFGFSTITLGEPISPPMQQSVQLQPGPTGPVSSQIPGQQFGGGGPSFMGGTVFQTPIGNLSLTQIIEMFGVSASQARDIMLMFSMPEFFRNFNFGTNTGMAEFAATRELPLFQQFGNVSDPRFQDLTPEQIFSTFGVMQNF